MTEQEREPTTPEEREGQPAAEEPAVEGHGVGLDKEGEPGKGDDQDKPYVR